MRGLILGAIRHCVFAALFDLDAEVEVVSGPGGVNVSLTHAAFPSRLRRLG
jgi:hypothetical protein